MSSPRLRVSASKATLFLAAISLAAAVVDRVAVVVGNTVITESEVLQEVRLTEFLNQQPLELDAPQRRAAADRLVDQQLIRNEMAAGSYPMPSESEAADMLAKLRDESFGGDAQFRAAMQRYGITEDELKRHLLWQLAAIRFTDARFQPGAPPSAPESANRLRPGAPMPAKGDVDQQLEAWLKEARGNTKVQFKQGAFQ